MPTMSEWLLMIFVFWMALQLGGGLYEKQVIVSQWRQVRPSQLQATLERTGQKSSAMRFWMFVSPVVAILAFINLIVAWRLHDSLARTWWLSAAGLSVVYSLFTYGYFVPRMIRMWEADSLSPEVVARMLSSWVRLNSVRLLIGIASFICAIGTLRLVNSG